MESDVGAQERSAWPEPLPLAALRRAKLIALLLAGCALTGCSSSGAPHPVGVLVVGNITFGENFGTSTAQLRELGEPIRRSPR